MLLREPLVSDNPFRLLGVPSLTPYPALRRKADAIARSAMAGLPHDVPLSDRLVTDGLSDLASQVRSLAADPRRRTAFRLMWPFEEEGLEAFTAGGTVSRSRFTETSLTQLLFLDAWLVFVASEGIDDLRSTLEEASKLLEREDADDSLARLLVEEDGLAPTEARATVVQARSDVARHLLSRAATVAAKAWGDGRDSEAIAFVEAILASPFDDALEEAALDPIVAAGDALAESIRAATAETGVGVPTRMTRPPRETTRLAALAKAMRHRRPSSVTWEQVVQDCHNAYALWFRDHAVRLANDKREDVLALEFLDIALGIKADADVLQRIREDQAILKQNIQSRVHNPLRQTMSASSAEPSGGTPWGCLSYIGIALLIGMVKSCFRAVTSDSSSRPKSSYSTPSLAETGMSAGDWIITDHNLRNRDFDQEEERLNRERDRLESVYREHEKKHADIDRLKREIDRHPPNRRSVASVNRYNLKVNRLNEQVRQYNEGIKKLRQAKAVHEKQVKQFNGKVKRYNAEADKLNRSGGQ